MRKFWNWIKDADGGRVLRLEGPIDEDSTWSDGITPKEFRDDLYAEEGDITIWLHSPGGSVFAAAEIYSLIRDYPGYVTVKIDSIAASAASVVAMAGDKVMMSPVALLFIHDPMTIAMGNAQVMEKTIATLNEIKESLINAYQSKSGMSRNKIARLMSDETWIDAKKAVQMGLADEIMFTNKKGEDTEDDNEREVNVEPTDALGGLLYSSRHMGERILNQLGIGEAGGGIEDVQRVAENEAPEAAEENTDGSLTTVDEPSEGETAPVEEDPVEEEEPAQEVTEKTAEIKVETVEGAVDDSTVEDTAEVDDGIDPANIPSMSYSPAARERIDDEEAVEDEKKEEGYFSIGLDGRTRDGSVPYIILKNRLEAMR